MGFLYETGIYAAVVVGAAMMVVFLLRSLFRYSAPRTRSDGRRRSGTKGRHKRNGDPWSDQSSMERQPQAGGSPPAHGSTRNPDSDSESTEDIDEMPQPAQRAPLADEAVLVPDHIYPEEETSPATAVSGRKAEQDATSGTRKESPGEGGMQDSPGSVNEDDESTGPGEPEDDERSGDNDGADGEDDSVLALFGESDSEDGSDAEELTRYLDEIGSHQLQELANQVRSSLGGD